MKKFILCSVMCIACISAQAGQQRDIDPLINPKNENVVKICDGIIPLYASGEHIFMGMNPEIMNTEISVYAQIDRGFGLRNRPVHTVNSLRFSPIGNDFLMVTDITRRIDGIHMQNENSYDRTTSFIDISSILFSTSEWFSCQYEGMYNTVNSKGWFLSAEPLNDGLYIKFLRYYEQAGTIPSPNMPSAQGMLPVEMSLKLTIENKRSVPASTLIFSSTLPDEYRKMMEKEVKSFNISNMLSPVRIEYGGEVVNARSPYVVSYDSYDSGIDVFESNRTKNGKPVFARINFGAKDVTDEAFAYAIRTLKTKSGDYSTLLNDEECIINYRKAFITKALQQIFNGENTEDYMNADQWRKSVEQAQKRVKWWDGFLKYAAKNLVNENDVLSRLQRYQAAILQQATELYIEVMRNAPDDNCRNEVSKWINDELTIQVPQRFSCELLRTNSMDVPQIDLQRRSQDIWRAACAILPYYCLNPLIEEFRKDLHNYPESAIIVQNAFASALVESSRYTIDAERTIKLFKNLYAEIIATEKDPVLKAFAQMQYDTLSKK